MSLSFDVDGEPILTEEEKRDEFIEIICANCTVDGEDCNALTALECPCVMLALDHYAVWGKLGPCGHEFCPPCVACGYPASTKPIYDKAVGTLICTRCGTKQYAKPPKWG